MKKKNIVCGALKIEFGTGGSCLPERVILVERDGTENLLLDQDYRLEAELADGMVIRPWVPEDCQPLQYRQEGAVCIEFTKIPWKNQENQLIPDFYFSVRHEFFPDGTAFSTGFFTVEKNCPPEIRRFELIAALRLQDCTALHWGVNNRLRNREIPLERFLNRGENRIYEHGIFPTAGFCGRKNNAPAVYAEMFVEGDNTVSGNPADNASSVRWEEECPVLSWNFQTVPSGRRRTPLHWRNCWGWYFCNPPVRRHLPPQHMYHYFDLTRHYPSCGQIQAMAEVGCTLLVVHENWRLDVQNDGIPYDIRRFRQLIQEAHERNIRVAVYIRGNETSVREGFCPWFRRFLRKNYDGLYMDYGGPDAEYAAPDEVYQKGRMLFREYYRKMRSLRQTVGPDGVFFCHTGPTFSGVGISFMDGYVSGEGERGAMIRGRLEHEYYSMAYAALGTMWTAAFPEYSSPAMVPFLAAAGQYPHSPLGVQFPASSLVHPQVPGINDLVFRQLWKLWSCFRAEKDMMIFNDYNCRDVFRSRDLEVGFNLMVSEDGKKGLLIVANFMKQLRNISFALDKSRAELKARRAWALTFAGDRPCIQPAEGAAFSLPVQPQAVSGLLFTDSPDEQKKMLQFFSAPCPEMHREGREYLAEITEQRKLRNNPPLWKQVWMTVTMPFYSPVPFEDSMIVDDYNETLELGCIGKNGAFRSLGWIGMQGLTETQTCQADQLYLGDRSAPVPLHEILPAGIHSLALRTWHLGMPFYSFVDVRLASSPDGENGYDIRFYNDLEPDRAYLRWKTGIA